MGHNPGFRSYESGKYASDLIGERTRNFLDRNNMENFMIVKGAIDQLLSAKKMEELASLLRRVAKIAE